MIFQRVNFGFGLLAAALSSSDTTMTMSVGHYLPTESGPMRLVIWNSVLYPVPVMDPNFEVVTAWYTGSLNVYTIERAQEDTFAHPHAIGDKVAMTYTKGVSSSDLYVLGSKELDESNIGDQRVVIYNAALDRLEYGLGGGGGSELVTKTLWVDGARTDTYTLNGSRTYPYKTIQDAINKIITLGDNDEYSYLIEVSPGVYYDQIVLENANLRNIYIHGNGEVILQTLSGSAGSGESWGSSSFGSSSWGSSSWGTSSGGTGPIYALRSIANNANLLKLHIDNIIFEAPFVIHGVCGGNTLSDCVLNNCEFISEGPNSFGYIGGIIDLTAVNNFQMKNCRSTESIIFNNVWWSYFESCLLEGDFQFTSSEVCVPASGSDNVALFNGTYLQGNVEFFSEVASSGGGGISTFTLVTNGSRIGKGNPVYVPPEVTVYALNSFLRGNWTNNGLLILSNSHVQTLSYSGIGLVSVDDQPASQIANDSNVLGDTVRDALNNLASGVGVVDHSKLQNLDYASAGHTGFQKELIWDEDLISYLIARPNN